MIIYYNTNTESTEMLFSSGAQTDVFLHTYQIEGVQRVCTHTQISFDLFFKSSSFPEL